MARRAHELLIGARRLPVDALLVIPREVTTFLNVPLSEAIRLIYMPRNLARSDLALVMSVFSRDSSSWRDSRKVLICSRISFASLLFPQIPMSQSSAYLTYSIREYSGLGIVVFFFRRVFTSLSISFFCSLGLLMPGGVSFLGIPRERDAISLSRNTRKGFLILLERL